MGKRSMNVGAGESTDGKLTLSSELASGNRDPQMGDPSGLTPLERRNLNLYGGGRGIMGFVGSTGGSTGGFAGIRGGVTGGTGGGTGDSGGSQIGVPVPVLTGTPNRRNRLIIIYPDSGQSERLSSGRLLASEKK